MRYRIHAVGRLTGGAEVPGDKSVSHRAALLGALADGPTEIHGFLESEDCLRTIAAVQALGADVTRKGPGHYRIQGAGRHALHEPDDVIDCGNSGTTARLLLGVLAGQPFWTMLTGDASLRRRPMARVAEPLHRMGVTVVGRADGTRLPLAVRGATSLRGGEFVTPVASAQVKSAILLAALRADGRTTVRESVATRDHTERMLRARGIRVEIVDGPDGGVAVSLEGGSAVLALSERVPGDVSAAAFWLVAGSIHPDAELTLRGVGVNPTRRAVVDILRSMGASIDERADAAAVEGGEPVADLIVRSRDLNAVDLGPRDVAGAIDEIPVLCLAAALANGTTTIRGAGELRHKESDRIAGIAAGLNALGARVEVDGDDITIHGGTRLRGAATNSLDDHRLAMTFAVAGLVAQGATVVGRPGSASISYPAFFTDLEGVRA